MRGRRQPLPIAVSFTPPWNPLYTYGRWPLRYSSIIWEEHQSDRGGDGTRLDPFALLHPKQFIAVHLELRILEQ